MTRTADIRFDLNILTNEASALIREEVRAGKQRERLENAVYDSVNKYGRSVEAISDATGLTCAEIRKVASTPRELSLSALAGCAI